MKHPARFWGVLLSVLAAIPLSGCGARDVSDAAPDFNLPTASGQSVSLSSYKGRLVVLNFWATWCQSCREELPILKNLQKDSKGCALLAVNVDDDPARVVPSYARQNAMTFPILYADPQTLAAYSVRMLPTTFLIGPNGAILRRYVGPLDSRAIENDILSLLNRRPS